MANMEHGHSDLAASLPFSFKLGAVGTGVGVGCGVGVGFGQPLQLGAVPAVGQAMQGVTAGLGQFSGAMGGLGGGAREAVRRLGVRGLDAGLGCGVGVGYGFGAGLFLKPSAVEQLVRALEGAAGSIVRQVQSRLQDAGIQLPGGLPSPLPPALPQAGQPAPTPPPSHHVLAPGSLAPGAEGLQAPQAPWAPAAGAAPWGSVPGPAAASPLAAFLPPALSGAHGAAARLPPTHQHPHGAAGPPAQQQPQPQYGQGGAAGPAAAAAAPSSSSVAAAAAAAPAGAGSEEFRALLRHERQIARLRAQNRALRRAVCKLDRRLPICQEPSEGEDSGFG